MVFRHPERPSGVGLVLTHGAGSNCESPLLVQVAEALAATGITVLRVNLYYRTVSPQGPPFGTAAKDRESLRAAINSLRKHASGPIYLGGHSYGGRQASILAAEDPSVADGLLLLSYPLHPPRKPGELRTAHFPQLKTAALFIQGTRDPFASVDELTAAAALISARTQVISVDNAGHELLGKRSANAVERIAAAFYEFYSDGASTPTSSGFSTGGR